MPDSPASMKLLFVESEGRDDVREVLDHVSAGFGKYVDKAGTGSRAIVIAHARKFGQKLEERIDEVLTQTTKTAREASREQLIAGLIAMAYVLPSRDEQQQLREESTRILTEPVSPGSRKRIDFAAHAVNRRFVTATVAAVAAREGAESRHSGAAVEVFRKFSRATANIVATTEVSFAFNDERVRTMRRLVRGVPVLGSSFEWLWDATLDATTCETCASLSGKRSSFQDGAPSEYGFPPIHPNCRCVVEVVPMRS